MSDKYIDQTGLARLIANIKANFALKSQVPTKVSDLTNDSGFLASVPNHSATLITSGTLDSARLPTSGVTAGSYGPSANVSPVHEGTFSVPYFTVNANGLITAASNKIITLPAGGEGSGMTITTLWFNSSPTSSFAAQTITLNSNASNYKLILITFRFSTSAPQEGALVLRYNSSYPDFVLMIGAAANNRTGARDGKFIDSGARIEFAKAGYNGTATNNGYAIPHYIYGLK